MKEDVKIKTKDGDFKFRVRGIVKHNEKIMCVCMQDADFFCLPGGHVEIGELTQDTVIREMKEELGIDVTVNSLVAIAEDIYLRREKLVHELGYFYLVSPKDPNVKLEDHAIFEEDKDGVKKLDFKWFTREEFKNIDFKPEYIKEKILENDFSFSYIPQKNI